MNLWANRSERALQNSLGAAQGEQLGVSNRRSCALSEAEEQFRVRRDTKAIGTGDRIFDRENAKIFFQLPPPFWILQLE
jgi:hypothetical protein